MNFNQLFLSSDDAETLDNLVQDHNEFRGFIIFQPGNYSGTPIDLALGVMVTGQGSADRVLSDPTRRSNWERFITSNKDLDSVEFHTHSRGTVKLFGQHYAHNLSSTDEQSILEIAETSPTYRHLLVTPEMAGLFSVENGRVVKLPGSRYLSIAGPGDIVFHDIKKGFHQYASLAQEYGVPFLRF